MAASINKDYLSLMVHFFLIIYICKRIITVNRIIIT